ncbi:MAG: methylmalonyl Co-A mutase-associated GTPase MeaB [Actinobacteria bacterium]|nr:methylmalonyl Co-A mutase-associated GTPase MeaB [Actinomycetota bacterium]
MAAGVQAGERRALARAITQVERRTELGRELCERLFAATGRARVVGLTGPPGAGKSTLVAALTGCLRAAGRRVAVVAVDPSSPFTAGALLGDRIRLDDHAGDEGVFVRSLASRGRLGGLARAVPGTVTLLDAAGYDDVLIETVGVGQSEIEIVGQADAVVLISLPGTGDETQMIKAGIMEVPDVIVVNRADDERARAHARSLRRLRRPVPAGGWEQLILLTTATTGEGVPALAEALDQLQAHLRASGELERRRRAGLRRLLLELALEDFGAELERRLAAEPALEGLLDDVCTRSLAPAAAARELLAR